jgi:hypothetical protein
MYVSRIQFEIGQSLAWLQKEPQLSEKASPPFERGTGQEIFLLLN